MKELKCPNCGAPINRETMRCDYCGAVFKCDVDHPFIYQIEHPKIVPLKTVMRVDRRIATMDGYGRCVADSVAHSLAEQMVKYMDVITQDDPMRDEVIVSARVRVVPPNVDIW